MKLPEPVDYGYRDESGTWVQQLCYTADQMRQMRLDTLEEAVLVCEDIGGVVGWECVAAIRALKEKTT